jgi:hypothetical protein
MGIFNGLAVWLIRIISPGGVAQQDKIDDSAVC